MDKMEHIRIPLVGIRGEGKYALVDGDYDGEYFGLYKWTVNPAGYVTRSASPYEERGVRTVYLHKEVLKSPPGLVSDHINRDKLDNRSCNLRSITQKQNTWNRERTNKKSNSGYRGVVRVKNRYYAFLVGKYIGAYNTALEAGIAWETECYKVRGEYGIYYLLSPTARATIKRTLNGKVINGRPARQ